MSEHRTAVFLGPGRIRIAKCSCGWESTPTLSSFKAEVDGQEHQRRAPADQGAGSGGEGR